jgi:type II secretory pathway component GspD/PulD (secretin)
VLTITPTINPDGYVNLQVSQTDNSATNDVQFDAPIINKREATTQIFIRDGQTTVIGGLAGKTHSKNISGIPFLSQIPIIGPFLFGQTNINEETTELYLFLTPHVITSDEDIDKLREAVKVGSDLLQNVNVDPHRSATRHDSTQARHDESPIRSTTPAAGRHTAGLRPPDSVPRAPAPEVALHSTRSPTASPWP